MNKIVIEKLANGNYQVTYPDNTTKQFEMAARVVTEVRVAMNYLKLP